MTMPADRAFVESLDHPDLRDALIEIAAFIAPDALPSKDWCDHFDATIEDAVPGLSSLIVARVRRLVATSALAARRDEPASPPPTRCAEPTPSPAPRWYTSKRLPPGAASWRAARETAHREGIPLAPVGRTVMIDAAAWDVWVESRAKRSTPRPVEVRASDAERLARMGLVLRGPANRNRTARGEA